jgi:hypothetical protein
MRGQFTPRGEPFFIAEHFVVHKMPNKHRGATLAEAMRLAEEHYADLGYVEPGQWGALVKSVEGLVDKGGDTDLAEFRDE